MSYTKILVPVAPGHGPEAGRSIEVARSLLSPEGTITVLAVLEDLPLYLAPDVDTLAPPVDERQRAVAKGIVDEFSAPDVEVITRNGHATRTIVKLAKRRGYDCIVIASAQPGLEHFLLGSTASGVVRQARCSVHVVRTADTASRS